MQKATLYAFLSVIAASVLLLGPYSVVHAIWNLGSTMTRCPQRDRLVTRAAIQQRVATCDSNERLYQSLVAPTRGSETTKAGPIADGFIVSQYKSAAEEIRARIGQEEVLFGLKFTLIGGIMAVLFSMFKNPEKDFFEKLVQKRRAAAFFAAALLTGVIVDTRLRFNGKIIESLGNWVWCIERAVAMSGGTGKLVPWEGFLDLQLDRGPNPVLRYSSHLLTALLYGVTVYLFIVMPQTINRSTRAMLTHASAVFFIILTCVALCYDCPYGRDWALAGSAATVLIAAVGLGLLVAAYRARFATSNACRLTEELVLKAEKRAAWGKAREAIKRARLLREKYDAAARLLEPALLTARLLTLESRNARLFKKRLDRIGMSQPTWRSAAPMAKKWKVAIKKAGTLSKVKSRGKLRSKRFMSQIWVAMRARCLWYTLRARYFEWKIARTMRPANVEAAHAAEEALWEMYFADSSELHAIPVQHAVRGGPRARPGRKTAANHGQRNARAPDVGQGDPAGAVNGLPQLPSDRGSP